ncbi:MAG: metallophosphoesterase family protein [Hyphomicrobiaceae bacterium]
MTRILHLTDLHLRQHQPGSAGVPDRLSREMTRILDTLSRRLAPLAVDLIAVTGDLLDVPDEIIEGGAPTGHHRDAWLLAVEQDLHLVREWLQAQHRPYVICPGNHDHPVSVAKVFPEASEIVDALGYRFFCFWDELGPDRQPRRTGSRLDLFDRSLMADEHDVPQIHIQHYAIEPPIRHKGWQYEYVGAQVMKQRLEESRRVRAVLSGHYHPGSLVNESHVLYSGAPSFCERPHRFRVYDFSDSEGVRVEEHCVLPTG